MKVLQKIFKAWRRTDSHPYETIAKLPSFPRTRESRINKARLFSPSRRQPPSFR